MPQVSTQEFERLPLRVHTFLAGVPLHDVWYVDLPRWRAGVTLDEFLRTASNGKLDTCGCSKSSSLFTRSPLVRMLLDIRLFVGRLFGWDHEPAATAWKTFATRLTDTDHSRSLAAAGTRDGFFRVVYHFGNIIAMSVGFIVVAILSGLPNGIASIFGAQLYAQPSWLPVLAFPWWICFGTIVTFFIAILFRSGPQHYPAAT